MMTILDSARYAIVCLVIALLLAGCAAPQVNQDEIQIGINADGQSYPVNIPAGSSVADALENAGIPLNDNDEVEPPLYTILSDADVIQVTRVEEVFETRQEIIPYERQTVRNESLPEGETRLIQLGQNGLKELTYRSVYKDGEAFSNDTVKSVILQAAVPEIKMVGVQTVFAPIPIPGIIAYMAGGNAWIMEDSTANRRALVTSGDLDGRVFALSPNAGWLLFSRKSDKDPAEEINTLWVVNINGRPKEPIPIGVSNVVHFAGWRPNAGARVYYSTVEPRAAAPGWQANNDLYMISFTASWSSKPKKIVDANAGGIYGWWGMDFTWSPDGRKLAYARPDGIGLVDVTNGELDPLLDITALNTHSDWAWIPGISWGADTKNLFTTTHAIGSTLIGAEDSPYFDMSAISIDGGSAIQMAPQTGMFAYPSASPMRPSGDERIYQVAYLQAIFPAQSESSRYRIVVMDRDGSNRRTLFPPADAPGLEPQKVVWTPAPVPGQVGDFLAAVYQGNLWLIDSGSGKTYQITGDGLISRIAWKSLSK